MPSVAGSTDDVLRSKKAGVRVKRGPDWHYGDQDGGGLGTTEWDSSEGWIKVHWDTGSKNAYRVGHSGKYDLRITAGSSPSGGFSVGQTVRIRSVARDEARRLQQGPWGGFNDTMASHLGRGDGTVTAISSNGGIRVRVNDDTFHWNPALIEPRPEAGDTMSELRHHAHSHMLYRRTQPSRSCDVCRASIPRGTTAFRCVSGCDWDCCQRCFDAQGRSVSRDETLRSTRSVTDLRNAVVAARNEEGSAPQLSCVDSSSERAPPSARQARLTTGDSVCIVDGDARRGQQGTIVQDDGPDDSVPYKVRFYDGETIWFSAREVAAASSSSTFKVGQRVECKDNGDSRWKPGTITQLSSLKVLVDGYSDPFSWDQVQALPPSASISPAMPGGYTVGGIVYSTKKRTFTSGANVDIGERGVVRGRSDDGKGLEVKFDGGVLVDCSIHQVSKNKALPPSASTSPAIPRLGRPTKGAVVRIRSGNDRAGELGLVIQDDHDSNPFKVRFRDGGTKWFSESEVCWCSASDMRAGSTADCKTLVALATGVGGAAYFAGEEEISTAMGFVANHAQGAVIGAAADFAAEELAAEGLAWTAAAILGAESWMALGPAGMVVGATLGTAAAAAEGAAAIALGAGAAGAAALEVGAAVGAVVEAGAVLATAVEVAAIAEAGAGLGAAGYAVASVLCIVQ